jgi:hypothetical protein
MVSPTEGNDSVGATPEKPPSRDDITAPVAGSPADSELNR